MCANTNTDLPFIHFFIFVPWIHLAGWKQPRLRTIWGRSYTNLKIFVAWSIESVNKYDELNSSNLEKLPFGAWTNWKFSSEPKMWPRVDSVEVFLWRPAKETCHNCESVRQRRRHEGHTFLTFSGAMYHNVPWYVVAGEFSAIVNQTDKRWLPPLGKAVSRWALLGVE